MNLANFPNDLLSQIFRRCPPEEHYFTVPRVCHRWWEHVLYNLRDFDSQSLKFMPRGGDDEEVASLFRRLTLNGRTTRLSHLSFFITPILSWESVFTLVDYASTRYSPNLVSLTVNFPFIPAIERLSNLQELTFDVRDTGSHFVVRRSVGNRVGGYPSFVSMPGGPITELPNGPVPRPLGNQCWIFPASGSSLQKVTILVDPNTIPDDLVITLPTDNRLAKLKTFVYRGPMRYLNYGASSIAERFPELEECEIVGDNTSLSSSAPVWTFPPSLTKLKLWLFRSFTENLEFASQVPNLTDLSILHEQRYVDLPWHGPVISKQSPLWDLGQVLTLRKLVNLRIASLPYKYEGVHDQFLLQLATLKQPPPLELIDIQLVQASLSSINSLVKAYPSANILFKHYQHITPDRPRERQNDYFAYVGRPASDWPQNTPAHSGPIGDIVSCPYCSEKVGSLVLDDHLSFCWSNPLLPCVMQSAGCRFVGTRLQRHEHHKQCSFYSHVCTHCLETVGHEDALPHYRLHNSINSQVQKSRLSNPLWKGKEYRATMCPACDEVLACLSDLLNRHVCSSPRKFQMAELDVLQRSKLWKKRLERPDEVEKPSETSTAWPW